jgi:hypothetical protein
VTDVLSGSTFDLQEQMAASLPYTRKGVTTNDIIPQDIQNELMTLDAAISMCFWRLGDIANELINSVNRQRSAELGKAVSQQDIFYAIGYFVHRTSRSIRYYYEVARWFPPDVRQKYDVPFTVWAAARWVKEPERLLQVADENPQYSAEYVRTLYYQEIGEEPRVRPEKQIDEGVRQDGGAEIGSDDNDLPLPGSSDEQWSGSQGRFKSVLISKLDHTLSDLKQTADQIPLPTDLRLRIGDCVLEIQDIILQVRRQA